MQRTIDQNHSSHSLDGQALARHMLESATYMSLATSVDDVPWVCGLFMGLDEQYNLYFVSASKTRHVLHILQNRRVSVAVFDSHAQPGHANGVQISGYCERLRGTALHVGMQAIYQRRYKNAEERARHHLTLAEFSKDDDVPGARHIYKVTPEYVYILNKTQGEDARVAVCI